MVKTIEYRVRPVTRYIVTRFESEDNSGASTQHGEFSNGETAYHVAYALCRAEHEKAGTPPGDENFQYPRIPEDVSVEAI